MFRLIVRHLKHSLLAATLAFTGIAPALSADTGPLAKDLTASIALLGLPCGQVVSVSSQGERDHLATCSDGNRYRVYVNAQGRVTAEKR
jgi:hypothetical protein